MGIKFIPVKKLACYIKMSFVCKSIYYWRNKHFFNGQWTIDDWSNQGFS